MTVPVAPAEAAALLDTAREKLGTELIKKLSAPFVLSMPSDWWSARRRLIFCGQETMGWGGNDRWDKGPGTLAFWLDKANGRTATDLAALHTSFHGDDPDRSSPFWRARTALLGDLGGWSVAWSNLMRADTSPMGEKSCSTWWNLTYAEVDRVCAWQRDLHIAELSALRPDAVIFFTGPHYDYCIRKTFDDVKFGEVPGRAERLVARVSAAQLPDATFRTYHPNYLSRSKQWPVLTEIAARLPG